MKHPELSVPSHISSQALVNPGEILGERYGGLIRKTSSFYTISLPFSREAFAVVLNLQTTDSNEIVYVIQETPKLKCFAGPGPEVFVQTLLLWKEKFSPALVSASPGPEHWHQMFQRLLKEMDTQCHLSVWELYT